MGYIIVQLVQSSNRHKTLVCAYTHACTHAHICTHLCTHTYIHTPAHTHTHTHECRPAHTHTHKHTHVCRPAHTQTHKHTHTHKYAYSHKHLKILALPTKLEDGSNRLCGSNHQPPLGISPVTVLAVVAGRLIIAWEEAGPA
jgi:hypothetical protein